VDAAELRRRCLALRGAVEDFPFGPETSVWPGDEQAARG
jgi:hypothetical protein